MANLHTIKAQLYDNQLTDNPNDFSARVVSERSPAYTHAVYALILPQYKPVYRRRIRAYIDNV